MSQYDFEAENKEFVENFYNLFKNFLITFKNNCKKVKNSDNFKNGYLKFFVYLINQSNNNKYKILSFVNSDINMGKISFTEELLFNQAQNAMIKLEFNLSINEKFDNLFVDDIEHNITLIKSHNNLTYFKNYLNYLKEPEFFSIDYFISEYIRIIDFINSPDFTNKLSYLQ
jgi:hypothetical protein